MRWADAIYEKELLGLCMETDVVFKKASDADAMRAKVKASREKKDPQAVSTHLPDTCAKTFGDRTVLASCTYPQDAAPGPAQDGPAMTTRTYYIVEALSGDRAQKWCIEKKGKWSAISRTSHEWKLAAAEADLRKDDADMKKLEKQFGE